MLTAPVLSTDNLMHITQRPDVIFVRGAGAYLFDAQGRRYLDWVQGWAVNCLGHAAPAIAHALAQQATTLINPSPAFYNIPSLELSNLLIQHSCLDQVFFANSGAEANEGAIKLARKWGELNKQGAFEIITFDNGYHGRTLATMSASGKPDWKHLFAPHVPGFRKASEQCYVEHGGGTDKGRAYGESMLLLSPRGLNAVITSHELTHIELHHRIGALRSWRAIPAWFDEGLSSTR